MTNSEKKPILAHLIQRVLPHSWVLQPGIAPEPVAPDAVGQRFDYPLALNTQFSPRANEVVSFVQLRALADNYDLLRLVIETRKDQISRLDWRIRARSVGCSSPQSSLAGGEGAEQLERFFRKPDRKNNWQSWLRALVEDLLVIDAPTIFVRRTMGGEVYALELIDGATIKRVVDAQGRTPDAPLPAYQQVLKGFPAVDYNVDELVYAPRNLRNHKLYGFSPVEQVLTSVNIAIRRQVHQLQYYTEGNVPEAMIGVPDGWTPEQIKIFQQHWDALLEGNSGARRHVRFVPGGMNIAFTKDPHLKDEYDEWLARVICYAFSLSPTAFVRQQNHATAQTVQAVAVQEGLLPLMSWVKDLVDGLLADFFAAEDYEFVWVDGREPDPLVQAQIDQIYLNAGVLSVEEVRAGLGIGMENLVD